MYKRQYVGQPVVVENRTGAGGAIANEKVATSPPDGYTLLMASAAAVILPALRKLPYDIERDLSGVSLLGDGPLVVVTHLSVPAQNIRQLVALARSKPNTLSYGTSGVGSTAHLAGELLQMMGKVKLLHVPFKASSEAVTATGSGDVDMNFPAIPAAQALVAAGRVKALAITSSRRSSVMPSIPTVSESGLAGYEYGTWFGLMAPANTPRDIVVRLHEVLVKIMGASEIRELFLKQGLEPKSTTPEEFKAYIHREILQNAKLVQAAGIKAD